MHLVSPMRGADTLAAPLGWVLADLARTITLKPAVGSALLTAERPRLHLLAFVLAMTPKSLSADDMRLALTKPMRDVLADHGFGALKGSRRVLGRIRGPIIAREEYRLLAKLLAEPSAASLLHHMDEISGELLLNIETLPAIMRSKAIIEALAHLRDGATLILLWTEIIARRLHVSADRLRGRLGQCRSHSELRTELEKLLDALPTLETAPPPMIDEAQRIDTPSSIRALGRRFRNCLAGFVDAEVDGLTHLYHWKRGENEAVCEVTRAGNVGWFLGNVLGHENDPLPDPIHQAIVKSFGTADIHQLKVIETYDDLYFSTGGQRPNVDPITLDLPRQAQRLRTRRT